MKRRAFTLIELLVVMAIISLLISILLPALSRSRQIGRATVCLSNLRSMCESVQMYADNNEGRLPVGGFSDRPGEGLDAGQAWMFTASQDLGSERISHCPADTSPHWLTPVDVEGTPRVRQMSYGSNAYMAGRILEREEYTVITRVKRPSTTIFWVELAEQGVFAVVDHIDPQDWYSDPRPLAAEQVHLDRHLGRANYGFLDGHSEPQRFEETYFIDAPASQFPNIVWIHNKYDPAVAW